MARCPTCHRRLTAGQLCPKDGVAPLGSEEVGPSTPPPPFLPGYAISKLLGTGGFGAVWEATDEAGRVVAVKIGHDLEGAEKLRREGDALDLLGPPCVPRFYGRGFLPDGRPFFSMERLSGRTLSQEIANWPEPPELPEVLPVCRALLRCARVIHERGVLHRDLKPDNVFLIGQGDALSARLVDFGLARSALARAGGEQTMMNMGAGTPEYMAPEQVALKATDAATDVYAFGLILYELFTLRLPFSGEERELEYAHLSLRPPPPSRFAQLPEAIESVILRCLKKDKSQRYKDGGALYAAFEQAASSFLDSGEPISTLRLKTEELPPSSLRGGAAQKAQPRTNERQKAILLFVQGRRISGVEIQAALEPFGGQLASAALGKGACAFTYRAGNDPARRAMLGAEALLAKGLAERVRMDVAGVVVRPRPGGPPRLFSPLFNADESYPQPTDPPGLLLSAAASAMLPSVPVDPSPARPNHFAPVPGRPDEPATQSRTRLADMPPIMVGRSETLASLLGEASTARAEKKPRVATLLGDAGLGKTRVAYEVARSLRAKFPEAKIIEITAREPLGRDTDEALRDLVRRALDLPSAAPEDGGQKLWLERLGESAKETWAGAALLLGYIPPDHPAVVALYAAPGVLRAHAALAGMSALTKAASEAPVFVLLDDAHFADDTLLDALEQATASELPLWVAAFGRPMFAENRPTFGARASHARVEQLEPLGREDAMELCRELLEPATNVPEPVLMRLVDRVAGVPLSLCDLVRGLKRQGLLKKRAGDIWYVATEVLDALPDSPVQEWIVGRELDELPVELSDHARLLSLLSFDFTLEEVDGVLGAMEPDLADSFPLDSKIAVDRLIQAHLLLKRRSGRLSFRNAATREAVQSTLPEGLALRIHQAALGYYRSAQLPDAARLACLAWHASRAGERAEAASTYANLAEAARKRHNFLEADLLYTRAIGELPVDDKLLRFQLLKGRGIVRYRLSRTDGSLADLEAARALAVEAGDPVMEADLLLEESMALDWVYEWRRSRDLAERARVIVPDGGSTSLEARTLLAVGRSLHRFGEDQEAAKLLRDAVRLAETLGDEGYEVKVAASLLLGFLLPFLGSVDEAAGRLGEAMRLCESKGDEFHLAASWNNQCCLAIARNDRDGVMEYGSRVLQYARRMGNANLERNANCNIAYFLHWRGEFRTAEHFARRMMEMDESYHRLGVDQGTREGGCRPEAALLLARILWGAGEKETAHKMVAEIRRHQEAAGVAGNTELLLQPNDAMLLDMIHLVVTRAGYAEWQNVVETARGAAQGQELIEVLEAAALAAVERGEIAAAKSWLEEAVSKGREIPNVMQERIEGELRHLA